MSYSAPQRRLPVGRWRGPGGAMAGDDALDPTAALINQVNRFGPTAPVEYRFATSVFPVFSGKISPALAMAALLIFHRRATDAYERFHDAGSESAITRANAGFADPVGFVTGNLAEVTSAIAGLADSLGLPAGVATGMSTGPGGLDTRTVLLVAGAAAVLWLVTR